MVNRREFLAALAGGAISIMALGTSSCGGSSSQSGSGSGSQSSSGSDSGSKVSLVKTSDRESGIKTAIDLLGINPVSGKSVLLKPNFNTADPFPASTHNDTLTHLVSKLQSMGANSITLGERSGPPDTADVMEEKGIYELCDSLGVGIINFEELPSEDWQKIVPAQSHWSNGFDVARPVLDSECVVTTCCLKTHGGGIFTMSLKLSVGITHKDFMGELHYSPDFLKMLAEINQAYTPSLILLDGIEAFVDGGPSTGPKKTANVLLAGTDRIAIDAVGVAILKELGSNDNIMQSLIFEQEQIKRAVELGLGVQGPEDIDIVTADFVSADYANTIREILSQG
jgi:uncharacterized protein (DUF362 family)